MCSDEAAQDMTIQARSPTPATDIVFHVVPANSEQFEDDGIEEVIVAVAKAIVVTQVHVASLHGGDVHKAAQDTTHHVHAPTTVADMVPDVAEADGERHCDGWAEAAPFVVGKATGTCAEPRIHRSPCQQRSDNRV